jgi:hypothetical protein
MGAPWVKLKIHVDVTVLVASGGLVRREGLQDLAQTRHIFPCSLAIRDELASVTIALAVAHGTGNSNGFTGIWESEFNFDFSSKFQFHSHQYAHPEFAKLSAASLSDQSFVLLVKNNPERDIELVAYAAAFAWVRRGQADSDFRGHIATLAVCSAG